MDKILDVFFWFFIDTEKSNKAKKIGAWIVLIVFIGIAVYLALGIPDIAKNSLTPR